MKKILVLHLGDDEETIAATFLGQPIEIRRMGTGGDRDRAGACIAEYDGKVNAIALEGFAAQLRLGNETRAHSIGALPVPEIGTDDALLRAQACGICGSDCEQFPGVLPITLPVIPGHEPVGSIERIGSAAARRWGVREGDRVVVEPILSCGRCRSCTHGLRHLCFGDGTGFRCYSYIPLSTPPGLWGAYADFMHLAPETVVHKIDTAVPSELAVLYNPLGAGFRWALEMSESKKATRWSS